MSDIDELRVNTDMGEKPVVDRLGEIENTLKNASFNESSLFKSDEMKVENNKATNQQIMQNVIIHGGVNFGGNKQE